MITGKIGKFVHCAEGRPHHGQRLGLTAREKSGGGIGRMQPAVGSDSAVPWEATVASAHAAPDRVTEWVQGAPARRVEVMGRAVSAE